MQYIAGAWNSLSVRAKGIVAILLIIVLGSLLAYSMFLGFDWGEVIKEVAD